jgi:rsbT co-antagonist protein RsbR
MSDHVFSDAERDDICVRIAAAISTLASVGPGQESERLKVDLRRAHPLNSVFSSINELISTLGAEIEQSMAFKRELDAKLAVVDKQRAAIRELSTPVIELWDGILCLPVVGVMDTARSTEMTGALLQSIVEKKTRFAIIDITGIDVMDTRTVDHFLRMAKSVRLLGAQCALTGINPHIAQTVVHMGIDMSDIVTYRTLRDALYHYVSQQT